MSKIQKQVKTNSIEAVEEPQLIQPLSNTSDIESLISQAINKNVPVETMEKLLIMRRELKAEKAKEEFDKAMSTFQSECPVIKKTKVVKTKTGQEAYKFAPIDSIISQVKEPLHNNGFSYSSNMRIIKESGETLIHVAVKAIHRAGHTEISDMTVPLGTQTQIMSQTQVVAAASTFAKRYAFCNAFGILTGDEDTDSKAESEKETTYTQNSPQAPRQPQPQETVPPKLPITQFQKDKVAALIIEKNSSMQEVMSYCTKVFKKTYPLISLEEANKLIANMRKRVVDQPPQPETEHVDPDEVSQGIEQQKMSGSHQEAMYV